MVNSRFEHEMTIKNLIRRECATRYSAPTDNRQIEIVSWGAWREAGLHLDEIRDETAVPHASANMETWA